MWVLNIMWCGSTIASYGPFKTQDDALDAGTRFVDGKMKEGNYRYSYSAFQLLNVQNLA
jgi:hypothetical protein